MGKKRIVISVIIIACILGGGLYIYLNSSKPTDSQQTKSQADNSPNLPKQESTSQPEKTTKVANNVPGRYIDYSKEALAKASGTKILFFYAPWCPQCRATDKSIKNSNLPDNLTIFKVDYDSNQALRKRYGVTIQTTFVKVDNSGNKIKSFVAYDEPTFAAVKRAFVK